MNKSILIKPHIAQTKNGTLMMLQSLKDPGSIPFEIKRVFTIKGMKPGDERGGHTHHETRQILFCIEGSCVVSREDKLGSDVTKITAGSDGIYLAPYTWHTMTEFADNTILLVVADSYYDEKDYIRSYDEFLKIIGKKK
jgi:dTDP-4-dehydrorhamnose 3,5-epimerase-like enzyme